MKVLGISGSPREEETTSKLVREVLRGAECEKEFVSLSGLQIGPCIACLRCVRDNVCKVHDDMVRLREKIVTADAYVIGAANYYGMLNGLAHCFLERFYQFRHREGTSVAGKLDVAVGVGGRSGDPVTKNIRTFFSLIRSNASVKFLLRALRVVSHAAMERPARWAQSTTFSDQAPRSHRRSRQIFSSSPTRSRAPKPWDAC